MSKTISFLEYINEELTKVGDQLGSNPGGVYQDKTTGTKHYVKFYSNPEQGKAEVLASKIYKHMGIKTLEPEIKTVNGKEAVVTKWSDDLKTIPPSKYEKLPAENYQQLAKMYHAAVLTKNWDIVGLEHDNIMQHKTTGELHAVDHGGAFHFRAQGSPKEFGPDVKELKTLRNPDLPSGEVFNHTFKQHPDYEKESAYNVAAIDDEHVKKLFANSGLKNWKELHKNFNKRKTNLLKEYV